MIHHHHSSRPSLFGHHPGSTSPRGHTHPSCSLFLTVSTHVLLNSSKKQAIFLQSILSHVGYIILSICWYISIKQHDKVMRIWHLTFQLDVRCSLCDICSLSAGIGDSSEDVHLLYYVICMCTANPALHELSCLSSATASAYILGISRPFCFWIPSFRLSRYICLSILLVHTLKAIVIHYNLEMHYFRRYIDRSPNAVNHQETAP